MTRRFPVPGDERVKYFFPYIYMGDGDYFYFVTPVGSFRVNQSFDSFAFKLGVSVTIGLIAGALVWHYFHREEPKKKESSKKKEDSVREVLFISDNQKINPEPTFKNGKPKSPFKPVNFCMGAKGEFFILDWQGMIYRLI